MERNTRLTEDDGPGRDRVEAEMISVRESTGDQGVDTGDDDPVKHSAISKPVSSATAKVAASRAPPTHSNSEEYRSFLASMYWTMTSKPPSGTATRQSIKLP